MSNTVSIGRRGNVGIAIETSAGVGGNTPAKFIPYSAQTLHNVVDILDDEAAKGIRERAWGSAVARTRGEGDITCLLDVENAPYLLFPALGTLSTQTIEAGAVFVHTMKRKASNPPKTVCLNIYDTVGTRRYHYATVNTSEITFSDGWVEMTAGMLSKAPSDESAATLAITEETVMAFKDAKIYFGATLAAAEVNRAAGTNAQALSAFRLTINNNSEAQYAAGDSSPRQISMGQFEVGGDYTLFFEDTTEQSQHENQDQRAMIISFTGTTIGASSTEEIRITVPKFHITDRGMDTAPAGFVTENPTFVADYDSTYGSISIQIINETSSYPCGTISSSSSSSESNSSSSTSSSSSSHSSSSESTSSSSYSSSSCSSSSASCS